jgi:cytochrome c-type protein NrfB
MNKTVFMIVATILLLVVAALAAEKNPGAPTLVIPAGIRPDVTLPHAAHQTALEDCDLCHNLFPQVAGSIVQMKASGALKKMQVMKQCRECHKEMTEAGKKAGPVNCDECHKQ